TRGAGFLVNWVIRANRATHASTSQVFLLYPYCRRPGVFSNSGDHHDLFAQRDRASILQRKRAVHGGRGGNAADLVDRDRLTAARLEYFRIGGDGDHFRHAHGKRELSLYRSGERSAVDGEPAAFNLR